MDSPQLLEMAVLEPFGCDSSSKAASLPLLVREACFLP